MRRRRLLSIGVFMCGLLAVSAGTAAADQVIFLVRHAERAEAPAAAAPGAMMANDPPLSAAGHERAKRLAALLASAGVTHIFATEYLRTRQTAAPLSEKTKVQVVMSAAKDPDPLIRQVRRVAGNVLIVGHTNTVPDLLKRLGVKAPVTIEESEYDNLFIVVRRAQGEPTLIRLRY